MAQFDLNNYVPVHERIERFYADNPQGRIVTQIERLDESGLVIFKAAVYRDQDNAEASATGHAYELSGSSYINKTSFIENCETSAIGRALANLGIEVSRGIASREEMQKVERMNAAPAPAPNTAWDLASHRHAIQTTCKALNAAGDSIKWAKSTLNDYVTDFFGEGVTYDNANEAQLKSIAADLAKRLGSMKKATAAGGAK